VGYIEGVATVLTIGNFDGVHLGHRALVSRCVELAGQATPRLRVMAMTFDPSPLTLLAPDRLPPMLCEFEERVDRLKAAGVNAVGVIRPTPGFLEMSPEQFVEALARQMEPRHVVTGADFRFGKERAGDIAELARLGERHGFETHVVPGVEVELTNGTTAACRSTLVRQLIGQGRLADAERCLQRPHELRAEVVRGEQRGRTLGFPTINLDPLELASLIVPPDGVYAGVAELESQQWPADVVEPASGGRRDPLPNNARYAAAISVGTKPTFKGDRLTVEAHLLDYAADPDDELYGRRVRLAFHGFLRDQQPFPSPKALADQLARDVERARERVTARLES
jgi:riboflavin kinase/FMN adenylyltransferase